MFNTTQSRFASFAAAIALVILMAQPILMAVARIVA
jgi:hypothetical protein